MTRPLHIGIDLDGTVIDNTPHFLEATGRLGYRLARWQVNSNVIKQFMDASHAVAIKKHVYGKARGSEEPFPHALAFIRAFAPLISIVSVQKNPTSETKVRAWLKRQGVLKLIPQERIHMVRSRPEKIARLAELKPDVFIDDGIDVLEFVHRRTQPMMFDPFHAHRRMVMPPRVTPVSSWRVVRQLLDGRLPHL